MEKATLFKLDIDIEAFEKKAASIKSSMDSLKIKSDIYRASITAGEETLKGYTEELKNLRDTLGRSSDKYKSLKKETAEFKDELSKQKKEFKNVNEIVKNQTQSYADLEKVIEKNRKAELTALGVKYKLKGSLKEIRDSLASNKDIYQSLSEEQRNHSKVGYNLLQIITDQEAALKKASVAQDNAKVSMQSFRELLGSLQPKLSNFSTSFEKQITLFNGFSPNIKISTQGLVDFAAAQWKTAKATQGFTKVFKILNAAMATSIIGIVVVAFGLLVEALSSSQTVVDAFNKALAPVIGAFKGIIGIIQDLAKHLTIITDTFTIVKNKLLIDIDLIRMAFAKLTGDNEKVKELQASIDAKSAEMKASADRIKESWEGIEGIMRNAGREVNKSIEYQKQIAQLTIDIENSENELIVNRAINNQQLRAQKEIADDIKKTEKERKQAAEESFRLASETLQEEQEILKNKIKMQILENNMSGDSRTNTQKLNKLLAEQVGLNEKEHNLNIEKQKQLKAISESERQQRLKAFQAAAKHSEEELKLFITTEENKQKSLTETLNFELDVQKKKKEVLDLQLKAELVSKIQYEEEKLRIDQEYSEKTAKAVIDNLTYELEYYKATNKSKIEEGMLLTQAMVDEEKARQKMLHDKEKQLLDSRLAKNLMDQKEYMLAVIALDDEFKTQQQEIDSKFDQQQKEQKMAQEAADYEVRIATETDRFEQQRIQEDQRYEQEQAGLQERLDKKLVTQEQFDKLSNKLAKDHSDNRSEIDKMEFNAKLDLAKSTFGNIASIVGEHTAVGKAAAIAQATINTYQAATAAYGAMSSIPVVGPILGAIAAAAAVAAGLANVKKIVSVKPKTKAEKGAVFTIGGNRHSMGGTKFYGEDGTAFEAEQGEKMFVLNRKASAAIGPLLSDLNKQYGGVSLSNTSSYLAAGGQVLRAAARTQQPEVPKINYDELAGKIGQQVAVANQQLPRPVVAVEDINYSQQSYAEVVTGANI